MKRVLLSCLCLCFISGVSSAITVQGINLDFVPIGNPGNAGDTRTGTDEYGRPLANPYGCGSVGYTYQIGKYEITASQWSTINTAAGIGDPGGWSGNQPTAYISWYDAAQFCNYLTSGNKYSGAYNFDQSGNFLGVDRDSSISTYGTTYVIPTEDEWYKAAYYTGSGYSLYANGTDTAPIAGTDTNYDWAIGQPWEVGVGNGTREQNGTFDMMGNVWEWNETQIGSSRGIRGGSYDNYADYLSSSGRIDNGAPSLEYYSIGFRVASVPEPCSLVLLGLGGLVLRYRKR